MADSIILDCVHNPLRILCTRELQNSIKDSVHKLLCDRIKALGVEDFFIVKKDSILSNVGSEIIFKGLRHHISEIKSTEGIDICWVEEAEIVGEESWEVLTPTIRKPGSYFYVTFNPESEHSATWKRFSETTDMVESAYLTYRDNIFFPDVLKQELEYDRKADPEKYEHVWEGKFKKYLDSLIFNNVRVESFETPETVRFYYGADWGYSVDPTTLVRMYVVDKSLYIDYCFYAVGVELTELDSAFETVPGARRHKITADSARPETISYMRNKRGFNIVGSKKGKGSVEDGIMFLRSFENIIIHPRCKGAVDDFKNYRWKRDRVTQEILSIPEDKSNHVPDAARYAMEELIRVRGAWSAV